MPEATVHKQESLTDTKVTVPQQCLHEGPINKSMICDFLLIINSNMALLVTVCDMFSHM